MPGSVLDCFMHATRTPLFLSCADFMQYPTDTYLGSTSVPVRVHVIVSNVFLGVMKIKLNSLDTALAPWGSKHLQ